MNERRRDELLDRIQRASGTIGGSIPETIRLEHESVPLRDVYFELARREELREEDRETVAELLSKLRRERLSLVRRIQHREVEYETGKSLVSEIRELDRAINAVGSLEGPSLDEELRREEIGSARELVELLRRFGKK